MAKESGIVSSLESVVSLLQNRTEPASIKAKESIQTLLDSFKGCESWELIEQTCLSAYEDSNHGLLEMLAVVKKNYASDLAAQALESAVDMHCAAKGMKPAQRLALMDSLLDGQDEHEEEEEEDDDLGTEESEDDEDEDEEEDESESEESESDEEEESDESEESEDEDEKPKRKKRRSA
jgi:hypothetical protein